MLGTGAIVKRPRVIVDEFGNESIGVRSICYLPLTYDHRLIDGADAGRFLTTIRKRLEDGAFEGELGSEVPSHQGANQIIAIAGSSGLIGSAPSGGIANRRPPSAADRPPSPGQPRRTAVEPGQRRFRPGGPRGVDAVINLVRGRDRRQALVRRVQTNPARQSHRPHRGHRLPWSKRPCRCWSMPVRSATTATPALGSSMNPRPLEGFPGAAVRGLGGRDPARPGCWGAVVLARTGLVLSPGAA